MDLERTLLVALVSAAVVGCKDKASSTPGPASSSKAEATPTATAPAAPPKGLLRSARAKLGATTIVRDPRQGESHAPPPVPPPELFELVKYSAPVGELYAYVSKPPPGGGKRPCMVWATGGFSNGIDEGHFKPGPRTNDQSALAWREAGIVLFLPSFRGGRGNPGQYEELYGEVDDFIAALRHVRTLPFVDPDRVYIGGHSTGGTLVLLAAELTDEFRAAIAFGPIHELSAYGAEVMPFDVSGAKLRHEIVARSPSLWLSDISRPTLVIEGASGNAKSAEVIAARASTNPLVRVVIPSGKDHFSVLRPASEVLAKRILEDKGAVASLPFDGAELGP